MIACSYLPKLACSRYVACLGIAEDGAGNEAEVSHPDGDPDHQATEQAQHQHPDARQDQATTKSCSIAVRKQH